jgi:hypothetical protein
MHVDPALGIYVTVRKASCKLRIFGAQGRRQIYLISSITCLLFFAFSTGDKVSTDKAHFSLFTLRRRQWF